MGKFFFDASISKLKTQVTHQQLSLVLLRKKKTSVMKKSSTIKKVAFCYPPSFQKKKGGGGRGYLKGKYTDEKCFIHIQTKKKLSYNK